MDFYDKLEQKLSHTNVSLNFTAKDMALFAIAQELHEIRMYYQRSEEMSNAGQSIHWDESLQAMVYTDSGIPVGREWSEESEYNRLFEDENNEDMLDAEWEEEMDRREAEYESGPDNADGYLVESEDGEEDGIPF